MADATPAPALRPMTVADLVDEIFRLYRRNFGVLFGISALLWLPAIILITTGLALLGVFEVDQPFPLVPRRGAVEALVIGSLVFMITVPVMVGALVAAISDQVMRKRTTIGSCLRRGLRALPRILGAYLLIFIAIMLSAAAVLILFAVLAGSLIAQADVLGQLAFVVVLLLVITVPMLWIVVTTAFAAQAIVIERAGVFRSLGRSAILAAGARWRIIGIYLLLSIISVVLFSVPSSFVTILLVPTLGPTGVVLGQLVGILAEAVSNPIQFGTLTLLYYDLRVRKEAYDLTVAAEAPTGS